MRKRLLKIFLTVIITFAAIFFFTKSVKSFLNSHPTFKIKKIEISYLLPSTLYPLPSTEDIKKILDIDGQTSIFSLNLKQASRRLEEKPEIKKAVIIRRFPDTLIIQLEKRKPFAQICAGRYFLVDEQGVILPEPKNFPFANFPLIEGINFQMSKLKIGRKYISQNLNNTLSLAKFLSSFREFEVKKINVKDTINILLYLQVNSPDLPAWSGKTLLIKIRDVSKNAEQRNSLAKKIRLLPKVLSLHHPQDVSYIDLRFKDIMVNSRISTNR